jgi:hypothetical protein
VREERRESRGGVTEEEVAPEREICRETSGEGEKREGYRP